MKWRIYYDDESTFDDSMGSPEDAPGYGVIAVTVYDRDNGRLCLNGWDWYYFDGDSWWGADLLGMIDRLCHRLPTIAPSQGRMCSTELFRKILGKALYDPDFPPRNGNMKRERPFQQVG